MQLQNQSRVKTGNVCHLKASFWFSSASRVALTCYYQLECFFKSSAIQMYGCTLTPCHVVASHHALWFCLTGPAPFWTWITTTGEMTVFCLLLLCRTVTKLKTKVNKRFYLHWSLGEENKMENNKEDLVNLCLVCQLCHCPKQQINPLPAVRHRHLLG